MQQSKSMKKDDGVNFIIISSVFLTLFFFFIDEGYYSFAWMTDIGSWVAFIIYTTVFVYVQYFIRLIFPKSMNPLRRDIIIASIGLPLALVIIFMILS